MTRTQDILMATSEAVRRIENWMAGLRPGDSMKLSDDVMLAIESAAVICAEGDIPEQCRDLCTLVMPKLAVELQTYQSGVDGSCQPNGSPTPSFWAAARAVAKARIDSDQTFVETIEPVAFLIKNGVTHDQIAFHIYGWRGQGPFVTGNGICNVALIEKEAATPNSVIPADWVHPSRFQAAAARKKELEARLEAYKILEVGQKRNQDPATIEQMLRDGCYIQQIERGKGVTREEVLVVAEEFDLQAIDGPGYAEIKPLPPATPINNSHTDESRDSSQSDPDDFTRQMVIAAYEGDPTKGAAEIAADLKTDGLDVKTVQVSNIIRGHKNSLKKAAATV